MNLKLSDHQLKVVKTAAEMCEHFADQLLHIMKNHGLDKVEGMEFEIRVNPSMDFATEVINIGEDIQSDAGHMMLVKGKKNEKFSPCGANSAEYELLFADETIRERFRNIVKGEKPLPPDGLWIGDPRNDPPVDSGEWDVNDSLS